MTSRTRLGSHGKPLNYEKFEERRMLAANLELYDAHLVDGNFDRITSTTVGEKIGILAKWNATDLPPDAEYTIAYFVDGVQLDSVRTWGAGSGNTTWFNTRTGWYANGQTQNVSVVIDVTGTVAEDNEGDNTQSFSFTASAPDIPQKLIWPSPFQPYSDLGVGNYVDVDPSGGVADYNGGSASYNGHNAFDAGPGNFQYMDSGVPLVAAADGVVVGINDGEYDRNTSWDGQSANYVQIDHGDGWGTFYWHLRRDSVQVEVGQSLSQGDFLGYMGSSGISTGLHIHFGLTHHGRTVEPMYSEADYFEDPFGYNTDEGYAYHSSVSNYAFAGNDYNHWGEGGSTTSTYSQDSGQLSAAYVYFSGINVGDEVQWKWYRPDGSLWQTRGFTSDSNYGSSSHYFSLFLPSTPDLGTWRVDLGLNDEVLAQEFFDVTPEGAPEMRVEASDLSLIVDDRFTPLDFGDQNVNAAHPEQTYIVTNHGSDTLLTEAIQLPDNYYLVEGLTASLEPQESDTFTIAMDTSVPGYHGGEVRIPSNDADESVYDFSIEGYVESGLSKLVLGISELNATEGQTLFANLRRPDGSSGNATIALSSNAPSQISIPSFVSFPGGEDYIKFEIEVLDDFAWTGDNVVEIYATNPVFNPASNELLVKEPFSQTESRSIIYDDSTFSGAGTNNAIATDKSLLMPGETATFENYSSYLHGINGLVVDANLLEGTSVSESDFEFRFGNNDNPSSWPVITPNLSMTIEPNAGENGSDRFVLQFDNGAITNGWLEVRLLANANTGLRADDIFYFGNAIGETGNSTSDARVNLVDVAFTRANQTGFTSAPIDNAYDFNRDGRVNLVDVGLARSNQSGFNALNLITPASGNRSGLADSAKTASDSGQSGRFIYYPADSSQQSATARLIKGNPSAVEIKRLDEHYSNSSLGLALEFETNGRMDIQQAEESKSLALSKRFRTQFLKDAHEAEWLSEIHFDEIDFDLVYGNNLFEQV